MNEVEKMYENARVEPEIIFIDGDISKKEIVFTAEKQIELIKLLAKNDNIYIIYYPFDNTYNIRYCVSGFYDGSVMGDREVTSVNFEETLAKLINNLWQDLTEEERKQIKEILE